MKGMMKLILVFIGGMFLTLQITGTFGQEDVASTQAPVEQANAQDQEEDEQQSDEVSDPEQGRFIPTEQVSQDLGVSFPSDI